MGLRVTVRRAGVLAGLLLAVLFACVEAQAAVTRPLVPATQGCNVIFACGPHPAARLGNNYPLYRLPHDFSWYSASKWNKAYHLMGGCWNMAMGHPKNNPQFRCRVTRGESHDIVDLADYMLIAGGNYNQTDYTASGNLPSSQGAAEQQQVTNSRDKAVFMDARGDLEALASNARIPGYYDPPINWYAMFDHICGGSIAGADKHYTLKVIKRIALKLLEKESEGPLGDACLAYDVARS